MDGLIYLTAILFELAKNDNYALQGVWGLGFGVWGLGPASPLAAARFGERLFNPTFQKGNIRLRTPLPR